MKRFRPPTWTGRIAGPLLTLLAGAIGLTDAAQARNESVTETDSAQVSSASTDQDTGAPAADEQATTQVAPQAKTLKPKIVFAQHVILWEGTEILTRDQLLEASRVFDNEVYDRAIDIQILRLRRKIERDPSQPEFIVTERGAGYLFNATVQIVY